MFLSLVVVPLFRRLHEADRPRPFFRSMAIRFRVVVWVSTVVLVATGPWLLSRRVASLLDPPGWPLLAQIKVLLVAILIGLTAAHDFWLGPKLAQTPSCSDTSVGLRLRRLSPWVARLSLLLALGVLFVAASLART